MGSPKDALVREFAERIDGLMLAADIGPDDAPYIVDQLVHEMLQRRVVVSRDAANRLGEALG